MHHRRKTLAAGVATGQRDRLHWRAAERTRPSETGTPLAALPRKINLQRWAMPPRCLPVGADTAYQPRRVESGAGTALCTKAPRTHTAAAAPSFGEAQPARRLRGGRIPGDHFPMPCRRGQSDSSQRADAATVAARHHFWTNGRRRASISWRLDD